MNEKQGRLESVAIVTTIYIRAHTTWKIKLKHVCNSRLQCGARLQYAMQSDQGWNLGKFAARTVQFNKLHQLYRQNITRRFTMHASRQEPNPLVVGKHNVVFEGGVRTKTN